MPIGPTIAPFGVQAPYRVSTTPTVTNRWTNLTPPASGGGTVTSVGLALPGSVFSVTGSPVTTSGTLTGSFISQAQNLVLASPNGSSGVPSFRALVAADIPSLSYVTSVALALPASTFTVSGSPVTSSGTLTGTFATQTANTVFAGPTTGAAATPTWRALVAADIPSGGGSPLTTKGDLYTFSTVNARLPVGANNTILRANSAATPGVDWATLSALLDAVMGSTRGQILRRGSTVWEALGLGTTGQAVVSDGTDAKWGNVGGGSGGALVFVGAAEVSGSAQTTLSISGLDLQTDKRYFLFIKLLNATTSTSTISFFYNSDTTSTNYDVQSVGANGSTLSAGRGNNAGLTGIISNAGGNNGTADLVGWLWINLRNRPVFALQKQQDFGASLQADTRFHQWRTASTNVTGITLSASIASSLDVGTRIEIWKMSQ